MKKIISIAVLVAVGVVIAYLWQGSTVDEEIHDHHHEHDHEHEHDESTVHLSPDQIQYYGIEVVEAKSGKLLQQLSTRGKIILHPDHLVHVLPKISGVAEEAYKNVGDAVRLNEVIAVVQSQAMAEIKAEYLAALEKENLAQTLLDREMRLRDKRISPEQDFFNAKSSYEASKIQTRLTRQKLQAFGLTEQEIAALTDQHNPDLCSYAIRSPLAGTIIDRHITKGEWIDNSMTIYEIANLDNVWIEIGVFPKDLSKVKEGQLVQVRLPGDRIYGRAKIIYVSPVVHDETITSKAVAEMSNRTGQWRPGTFVTVDVALQEFPSEVVVPKEAIQQIEGESVVFVRVPDGFEKRPIQVGKSDPDYSEIISGLESGESYAASKTFLLKADLGKHDVEHEH